MLVFIVEDFDYVFCEVGMVFVVVVVVCEYDLDGVVERLVLDVYFDFVWWLFWSELL